MFCRNRRRRRRRRRLSRRPCGFQGVMLIGVHSVALPPGVQRLLLFPLAAIFASSFIVMRVIMGDVFSCQGLADLKV